MSSPCQPVSGHHMNCDHKVIITGTGRAGTTFLVQMLTELGLDTGYTVEESRQNVDRRCHAGLECDLVERDRTRNFRDFLRQPKHAVGHLLNLARPAPYIVKSPALCDTLAQLVAGGRVVVDHVYVPIRDLEAAALSRAFVGDAHGNLPGGLMKTDDPSQQKAVLAEMFFNLVYTLITHDLPCTFLLFPRLVEDWAYTFGKLQYLLKDVDPDKFRRVFAAVADPSLVHNFESADAPVESRPPVPVAQPERRRITAGAVWKLPIPAQFRPRVASGG